MVIHKLKLLLKAVLVASLIATPSYAQTIPTSIFIRVTPVNADTMQIRVTWTQLPPVAPSTITAYDVIMWSRPKIPIIEYFQIVTGDTSTYIRVPKALVPDSTIIYAAVRSSMNPRRGAITFRKP